MDSKSRRHGTYERKRQRRHNGCLWMILIVEVLALAVLTAVAFRWFAPGKSSDSGFFPSAQPTDTAAPSLSGVTDHLLYAGDELELLEGVTATDDRDTAPSVTCDTGGADLRKAGVYTVTYTAADAAGNQTSQSCTVTVLEKREGYKTLEQVYRAADERLEVLDIEGKTAKEQVRAIYAWARTACTYSGHTERTDYLQAGYSMLTTYTGDCYGYFSVCKLLFERLGIPNIDVRKVKNTDDDSDHFWSLVSVDGGQSWYHFDATPRVGSGDDFCLVTDAFLDAYSDAHKGSHNRDKSLYPKTPEA